MFILMRGGITRPISDQPASEKIGSAIGWTVAAASGGEVASIAKMYIFALAGVNPWPLCRQRAEIKQYER